MSITWKSYTFCFGLVSSKRAASDLGRVIPPRPRPTPSASKSGLAAAVAAFAAAAPTLAPRPRAAPAADAADAVAPCAGNWQWGNGGQPEPQSEGQAQQEPQDESQAEWQGGQSAWNNHGAWNSEGGQGMWKDEPGDQTMWNSQGAQSEAAHPEPQEPGYQALHATPQAASAWERSGSGSHRTTCLFVGKIDELLLLRSVQHESMKDIRRIASVRRDFLDVTGFANVGRSPYSASTHP